jgi:hypothetical protein
MYVEVKEVKIPEEILAKLEESAKTGEVLTLGEAGVFEWLTKLSREAGWRPVWQGFNFPYVILEREVEQE